MLTILLSRRQKSWYKLHHSLNMYWTNSYIKFTFPNLEFLCSRNWAIHIPLHIPFKILLSTLINIFIKGVLLQTICWITVSYRIDVIKITDDLLERSALLFAAEGKVISKNLEKYETRFFETSVIFDISTLCNIQNTLHWIRRSVRI